MYTSTYIYIYIYTVPEIVHLNRIISFLILLKDAQKPSLGCSKAYANVWFSRFPYFKVNFCSDFAMRSANERARSIPQS